MIYKNKTALVTGASSGIGAQFARVLARRGCDLILVARSQDKLQALADELGAQHNIQAHVIAQDLSDEWAARAIEAQVAERGLRVDILINNAGIGTQGEFQTLDADLLHRQIMLNVTALVDLTRLFLPAMVERQSGVIVNVASVAAFLPHAGVADPGGGVQGPEPRPSRPGDDRRGELRGPRGGGRAAGEEGGGDAVPTGIIPARSASSGREG